MSRFLKRFWPRCGLPYRAPGQQPAPFLPGAHDRPCGQGLFLCGLGSANFPNGFGRAYKPGPHPAQNLHVMPFRLRATPAPGIAVMSVPAHAWNTRSPATGMPAPVFWMPAPQAPFRRKSEADRSAPDWWIEMSACEQPRPVAWQCDGPDCAPAVPLSPPRGEPSSPLRTANRIPGGTCP